MSITPSDGSGHGDGGSRVGLWFCRVMGWHKKPYLDLAIEGINTFATCSRCGYSGMIDSQGNLF